MTDTWKVQDVKARFSELLDATLSRGPQIVTRRGVEEAVVLPIAQWRSMEMRSRPSLNCCGRTCPRPDDCDPQHCRFSVLRRRLFNPFGFKG